MTAIANTFQAGWATISTGKLGFVRFYTYLGLIAGLAGVYYFGGYGAYGEGVTSTQLMYWGAAGLGAGLIGSIVLVTMNPGVADAKFNRIFLPWLDGAVLMLLITSVWVAMSPSADVVTLEDQSLIISPQIITGMYIAFILSAIFYITYLFAPANIVATMGAAFTWIAVYLGGSSLLLRWYESYLVASDIGHAPVSNLYEVFILLFLIASLVYLGLESRFKTKALGAFVMPLIVAGVFFAIWLEGAGHADIKPLVPALQSYWMKIHVPMNFVGYGSFGVACGAGMLYLLRARLEENGGTAKMLAVMPSLTQIDDLIYYAVIIGYPAFTLATILGAAWAAEAWGGYWSWDPKETWALIVWLTYGAFLHVRITHGWRGKPLAWWAISGFLVTMFCFLGVNMYLSGLHSYGSL